MGLTTGPVPARVDAPVKQGLLALVDHAVGHGWSTARACRLLQVDPDRLGSWRRRAVTGRLTDLPCGGGPVHGLLESERAAILDLFEAWGQVDRGHRKLAARGSRLDLVHVSASTLRRGGYRPATWRTSHRPGRVTSREHERENRCRDHRAQGRVGTKHQHPGGSEDGVREQAQGRGVQPSHRRQSGQVGVRHSLRHQQRRQNESRDDIPWATISAGRT